MLDFPSNGVNKNPHVKSTLAGAAFAKTNVMIGQTKKAPEWPNVTLSIDSFVYVLFLTSMNLTRNTTRIFASGLRFGFDCGWGSASPAK